MIGLLAGSCQPAALATEYTEGLTGSVDDAAWLGSAATVTEWFGEVKYDFSRDATFRLNQKQNAFGLQLDKDAKVTLIGKNLTFDTTVTGKGNSDSTGIHVLEGSTLTINSNVSIEAHNRAGNFSNGINIDKAGTGEGVKTTVTINGNLTMRNADTANPWGVTSWNIHGGYGPGGSAAGDAPNYTGARWQPTGIRLATGHGSVFTVNGDVDLAVKGTAVTTDPYYSDASIADKNLSVVNLNNGNIRIDTPESNDETYYALANYGGTINVNMNKNKDVNINGNLIVMKEHNNSGMPYFYQDGEINLALTNNNSKWTGVVDNSGAKQAGDLNLWLQNGAQWEHRSLSKTNGLQVQNMPFPSIDHYGVYDKKSHVKNLYGGADAAHAGFILQKDPAQIVVENYSGHTTLAYAHTGAGTATENYVGGNFTVNHAATGSGITLSTDSSNMTLTDDNMVGRALNALAGKLYYTAYKSGERNLTGKVQIADGLTSSSAVKKLGNLTFEDATGKGKAEVPSPPPSDEQNKTEFTAQITSNDVDEYKNANVEKATGVYTFTKDSTLNYAGENDSKGAVYAGSNAIKIEAKDHVLTVNVKPKDAGQTSLRGIGAASRGAIDIKAKRLTLNVNAARDAAVTEAVGVAAAARGADMNFAGMTEIHTHASNRSIGASVTARDGKLRFDGLRVSVNKEAQTGYALQARGGLITVNTANGTPGTNEVQIDGNIIAAASGIFGAGQIEAALTTQSSYLHGLIAAQQRSSVKLALQNGATWRNENYSNTTSVGIHGSRLVQFTGGSDAAHRGIIEQRDAYPLHIGSYSGHALVFYEHSGNGSQDAHYTAGSTIIDSAASNSAITMATGNNGIMMDDEDAVDDVLNALAGKLTYKAWANGEKNLAGTVMIADGLTASSAAKVSGAITYDSTGKGGYGKAQTVTDFTTPITGDRTKDQAYIDAHVLKRTGKIKYTFTKNSTIRIAPEQGQTAIDVHKDISINAAGQTLTLGSNRCGLLQYDSSGATASRSEITADKVIVDVNNENSRTDGIYIKSGSLANKAVSVINGSVDVKSHGVSQTTGLYSAGNAFLTVNGDVIMKDANGWAVSGEGNMSHEGISAVYAGSDYTIQTGGHLDVNGNLDLKVSANGVLANGGGSTVNIKGGGTIEIDKDNESGFMAIAAQSGIANMNMNDAGDGYGTHKVNIKGNLGVTDNSVNVAEPFKDSIVNLGLGTADSTLHGVVVNNFSSEQIAQGWTGKANLYMAGGATWTNEQWGKTVKSYFTGQKFTGSIVEKFVGSSDADNPAYIIQKDKRPLMLKNYSGNTLVYYAHTNDGTLRSHYKAGDTIITSAAPSSGITMSTDNSGIHMDDSNQVAQTLNALAGKLTYENYKTANGSERNLKGLVQIADGMTASSAAQKIGNVTFDETSGKGGYIKGNDPSDEQTTTDFTAPITGDKATDTAYVDGGVLKRKNGKTTYVFTKDSTIHMSAGQGAAIQAHKDVIVNAAGRTLTLTGDSKGLHHEGNKLEITADKIIIDVNNAGGRTEGVHANSGSMSNRVETVLNGNVDVKSHGSSYALGFYTAGNSGLKVNGNVTMRDANGWAISGPGSFSYYGMSALYAGSNYGIQKGGQIDVSGDVDLKIDGNGIFANGGGSTVTVAGGGTIEVKRDNANAFFAIMAQSGVANMNMNAARDGHGTHKVDIKGNLGVLDGSVNAAEPFKDSIINLGLGTADSTLHGVVMNNFSAAQIAQGFTGKANLYMAGGATWTNEMWGKTPKSYFSGQKFAGSIVENFAGSKDAQNPARIIQKDAYALTLNNYSGNALVYYAHTNDGSESGHYAAGDTIIGKAAADSAITLSTDNSGMDMRDNDKVARSLNALAGKLTYKAWTSGEKNLAGKVQIADGMTASSAVLQAGKITYDDATGKGSYKKEKPQPPEHQTTVNFTAPLTGDKTKDQAYIDGGVLKEKDGKTTYVFTKNTDIQIAAAGGAAIDVQKDVAIEAKGSTLTLHSDSKGISQSDNKAEIATDKISIDVNHASGRTEGISVKGASRDKKVETILNGNVDVRSRGKDYALGIYSAGNAEVKIKGDVTMKAASGWAVDNGDTGYSYYGASALYAGSNHAIQKGGSINVAGDVDLKVNANGIFANGGGSAVNVAGGTVEVNKDSSKGYMALLAQSGVVNMNMNTAGDGYGARKATVKGNIGVLNGSVNAAEPFKDSIVNLGLGTADSTLHGVVMNNFTAAQVAQGFTGKASLYMAGGATWTNEAYGKTVNGFSGSVVENFAGSKDAARAANIIQKDAHDLTINKYSGNTTVWYEHTGNGESAGDFRAGSTVIKDAAKGSLVTMSTDNTGITMTDDKAVERVLNSLAGKLQYMSSLPKASSVSALSTEASAGADTLQPSAADVARAAQLDAMTMMPAAEVPADDDAAIDAIIRSSAVLTQAPPIRGNNNLRARVQIAEGMTSSSVQRIGDIAFNNNHVGYYVLGSMRHGGTITRGDYETDMMRGTRSAMTSSMLAWRDNASALSMRSRALRHGAESGAWAQIFGGRNKYDGSNTKITGNLYGVQLGYDRAYENGWNAGVSFDYAEGSSDYQGVGKGDNKQYSVGIYGSKALRGGAYLDIAAKVGQVDNDFTAYNMLGQELKGDYKTTGHSVSVQYGQRIGSAAKSYVEPQVQLTWAHINGKDYDAHRGADVMHIEQDAFDSLVGRLGVEVGTQTARGGFYANFSLSHEFSGDVSASYRAKDGGEKRTSYGLRDTWADLTLGGYYSLNRDCSVHADLTRTLAGDYQHQWKAQIGLRIAF